MGLSWQSLVLCMVHGDPLTFLIVLLEEESDGRRGGCGGWRVYAALALVKVDVAEAYGLSAA